MEPRILNLRTNMLAMMALSIGSFPSVGPEQEPELPRKPVLIPPTEASYTLPSSMPVFLASNTEAPLTLPILAGTNTESDTTDLHIPELPIRWQNPPPPHLHQVTGSGKDCPCGHRLSGQELKEARERRAKLNTPLDRISGETTEQIRQRYLSRLT